MTDTDLRGLRDVAAVDQAVERPDLVETALALRALIQATDQFRTALAEFVGTDPTTTMALSYVVETENVNARGLARSVGLTPSAMTALLDRLENAGLARRAPHPSDRRQTVIVATEHGREVLDRVSHYTLQAIGAVPQNEDRPIGDILTALAESLRHQAHQLRAQ